MFKYKHKIIFYVNIHVCEYEFLSHYGEQEKEMFEMGDEFQNTSRRIFCPFGGL